MGSSAGLAPGFKEQVDGLVKASNGRVSITSGFRTKAQQVQARKDNGCPDIYKSPASSCRVPTAIPGTSKHESGLAVDFGGDLALADRLAPQYGMHRTVSGEPWHFEPTGSIPGVNQQTGGASGGGVVDAVAGFGGDLVESAVEPFLQALKRLTITGAFLGLGVAILAAGAYRSTTGRSAVHAAAGKAQELPGKVVDAGMAVATEGGSAAAQGAAAGAGAKKAAKASKAPAATPRRR